MVISVAEGKHVKLESWSDAAFAADKCDRKSVNGGVITVDGAVIHWMCKKKTGIWLSTMEAEFTSASNVGHELLGLQELVNRIEFSVTEPMVMKMDN